MTETGRLWAIVAFGLLTSLVLALGFGTLGGLMALVQLGGLIGAPTASLLRDDLRSRAAAIVIASVLSIAVTAIAVQSLVWFELASAELIVLLATVYGVLLARLLSLTGRRSPRTSAEVTRW